VPGNDSTQKSIFSHTLLYTLGFPNEEVRQAFAIAFAGKEIACEMIPLAEILKMQ
jgi:hypothetical protein